MVEKMHQSITEWTRKMAESGGFHDEPGGLMACNPDWLISDTFELDPDILETLINGLGKKIDDN